MLEALKKEVYEANMLLPKHGLVTFTWGNVSGIDRQSGLVAIKPSGVPYEELSPEKMVLVDLSGHVAEGRLKPSSDVDTHLELYRNFPEIGGVVHTHSLFATSFAQAKKPIIALGTTHADAFFGPVPCTRELTEEEINGAYETNTGKVIIETCRENYAKIPAVLAACHGPFAWGETARKAVENIIVLEEVAKMAVYTQQLNPAAPGVSRALLNKHYSRKHGKNAYYGQAKPGRFDDLVQDFSCACGKTHRVPVKEILLKPGALAEVPALLERLGNFHKIAMLCDDNTYKAAGKKLEALCTCVVRLNPQNLHADEKALDEANSGLPKDCDLILAVGAGTVHDIARFVAFKRNIPFVSVPTAPSVDGFVSPVAALTLRGVKVTVPAAPPIAAIADTDVLALAPERLISAGFADLLGKYTALADWKISHLVTGEYYCAHIAALEEAALKECLNSAGGLRLGQAEAVENLMYGLLLSGLAMLLAGSSRPASGAEHHISHFLEVTEQNDALHGEKVGVGLALCCDLYHALAEKLTPETVILEETALPEEEIRRVFGALSEEILKENRDMPAVSAQSLRENIQAIREILLALPTGKEVRTQLFQAGAPCTLVDIGLSENMREKLFSFAPYVRRRLTVLRLAPRFDGKNKQPLV